MQITTVDTIEDWPTEPGWLGEVTQLSPGPLGYVERLIDIGAVRLEWNSLAAHTMIRDRYTADWMMFAIQRDGPSPVRHWAHDIDRNDALVFSPDGDPDYEYVAPEPTESLWIKVSCAAAERCGWQTRLPQTLRAGGLGISHLIGVCRSATSGTLEGTVRGADACSTVLTALEKTFGPGLLGTDDENAVLPDAIAIEKGVRRLVEQAEAGEPLDVDYLANELGVSRRTLYRSLRLWPGVTPAGFVKTLKLHAVRRRLLAAPEQPGEVASIATEYGFTHLGRFSGDYRKFFGELPSQTLRH